MDLEQALLLHSKGIDAVIEKHIPHEGIPNLHDAVWYHLGSGGKRLRPALAVMTCEALGAKKEQALPFAAACQIFHDWLLIHDDLEDGDQVRRNQPAVWKKYGADHAINIGDFMSEKVYELILSCHIDDKTKLSLIQEVTQVGIKTAKGQALEMNLRKSTQFTERDYFEMVNLKTSLYLILPVLGGALISGADEKTIDAIKQYGSLIGPAFQITDDILDLTHGKGRQEIGCDIREGKRSLMVIHAFQHATKQERQQLLDILDRPRHKTTENDIKQVMSMFEKYGSIVYCTKKASDLSSQAKQAIVHTPPALSSMLCELADYMVLRRR